MFRVMGMFKNIFKKKPKTVEQQALENIRQAFIRDGLSRSDAKEATRRVEDLVGMNRKQRRAYLAKLKRA
jgi:hypothetical protein